MARLERRDFLKIAGMCIAALVANQAIDYFSPVLQFAGVSFKHPELDDNHLDDQSQRLLEKLSSIDPGSKLLSPQESAAASLIRGRYVTIDGNRKAGRLLLDMNYVQPQMNQKPSDTNFDSVGLSELLINPLTGVVESRITWGYPGYDHAQKGLSIDDVDAVGIAAHELLGHVFYQLNRVSILSQEQEGIRPLEIARQLNQKNPKESEEELESWLMEILGSYLYKKTHPQHEYTGSFYDVQEDSIDELGYLEFWLKRKSDFPEKPWLDNEIRWLLERDSALTALRFAKIAGISDQPLILPLTVKDHKLDPEFVENAKKFFIHDKLAVDYNINMDPTENNSWIINHLNPPSSFLTPKSRREIVLQTRKLSALDQRVFPLARELFKNAGPSVSHVLTPHTLEV